MQSALVVKAWMYGAILAGIAAAPDAVGVT